MGKHGPCYHCGVTSTPLWRNGPQEKPILCNACGSRWRTKGTLTNYTPLHAREECDDFEDQSISRVKIISINNNKEVKMLKRKQNCGNVAVGRVVSDYNRGHRKVLDEDTSNRSSSGSAISNSESCVQFDDADASELSGPAQSIVWDTTVPSKKRTNMSRSKPSSVEKLTKDLYTILHEQQCSNVSGSSQEDVLIESEPPMDSVEIRNGSVLIRNPNYIAWDEESEASSLSVNNKLVRANEAYSRFVTLPVHNESKGIDKNKKRDGQEMQLEQLKGEKSLLENFQILASCNSPLCNIDLSGVLNIDEFMIHLTNEEQWELMKYLPPVDRVNFPGCLKDMFDSNEFKEGLSSFQHLLGEGVVDLSLVGVKNEDCKTFKRLSFFNLKKSQWVECYNRLKKCRNSASDFTKASKIVNMKRSQDVRIQNDPEVKNTMKGPKRVRMTTKYENKEFAYSDNSYFSPRSLFALPPDNSSLMFDSLNLVGETSDEDHLLDVPSHDSFPQAELLLQPSKFWLPTS